MPMTNTNSIKFNEKILGLKAENSIGTFIVNETSLTCNNGVLTKSVVTSKLGTSLEVNKS